MKSHMLVTNQNSAWPFLKSRVTHVDYSSKKMGRPPYVYFEEYKAILEIPLGEERFKRLKIAADTGNIQAAFTYGEILMFGGWDRRRMEIDLACGRLLPETPKPHK